MTQRFRLVLAVGTLALAGCGDSFHAGPIAYVSSPKLATQLEGKPQLQAAVSRALTELYGRSPRELRVPPGAPLRSGGIFLANHVQFEDEGKLGAPKAISVPVPGSAEPRPIEGGYALYRKHCLHCHGVSGDGEGPTAAFLWPKPRDFRKGIFKFTSTTGSKPTRGDFRRTLLEGIPNTSMPSFEALMTGAELEQVIDYLIFLSLRGQTEEFFINEASVLEDDEAETAFTPDITSELLGAIFAQWTNADSEVLNPPVPRTPPTRESVLRGRDLFLGKGGLQCAGCHGPQGYGNGPSFVPTDVFNAVVFRGKDIESFDEPIQKLWVEGSLDEWGNPLRPANLNNGPATMYKGGRRPIDIFWRIAKGINGAKMPAHYPQLKPEEIWDLVNFVLALPYQPELLRDVSPSQVAPASVARR